MSSLDGSRAVIAIGLLALWMGLTDAMLKFLRPSMRPWLLTAAGGLVVLGISGLVQARRPETAALDERHPGHEHHRSRMGWLLVAPLVVIILFGPQPMGDFAVDRTPNLPEYAFDIAAYASQTRQRTPALRIADVLEGSKQPGNREYLAAHDVVLRGFVSVPDPAGPGSFVLTRYLITCCAADAQPLNVTIVGVHDVPETKHWLDVTARLEPSARRSKYGPVMQFKNMTATPAPSGPYEMLR